MPVRQNVKRFPSDVVQGEGSYVMFRRYELHEQRAGTREIREAERLQERDKAAYDAFVEEHGASPGDLVGERILAEHIMEWNWVDSDGMPFPQPRDDPAVIHRLTDEEINFLNTCMLGPSDADLKN